jgi:predicted membrane protein
MNWPPLDELAAVGALSFISGVLVGYLFAHYAHSEEGRTMWVAHKARSIFDRYFTVLFFMVALAALVGIFIGTAATITKARQSTENHDAQVRNCENANDTRAAQRELWEFILDVSASNPDEPPTPEERDMMDAIRDWIEELFAPRDCTDLTRKYEIPDPPFDVPSASPAVP